MYTLGKVTGTCHHVNVQEFRDGKSRGASHNEGNTSNSPDDMLGNFPASAEDLVQRVRDAVVP